MNEEASHQSHAMRWTLGVLAALLLYVLSYGPVLGLMGRGTIPPVPLWLIEFDTGLIRFHGPKWLSAFYQPVVWLHDNTPLQEPLNRYGCWWVQILAKP